ncbi:MAG: DUF493 domain-containing protein [Blastochloris sp.]|nr:DUF493 domain-containing protein [Blastochloris sp.]
MATGEDSMRTLKEKLDQHHQWPGRYPFKFIVKQERVAEVEALFPGETLRQRVSEKGNYVGLTLEKEMGSSEEVLEVYRRVSKVEGLLAL